jgi:N-acetylmuramoyl-L-alanine amidase.
MTVIEEKYVWRNTNFGSNPNPDTIVIHHALAPSCTAQDIHRWHLERGWLGIAYHYFIRKNGTVYRGRPEQYRGGSLLGDENINVISICLEGCYTDYGNLTEKNVPEAQMKALHELCDDICSRHRIVAFKRHADYPSAQGKDCPGKYFPWNEFVAERRIRMVSEEWKNKAVEFVRRFQRETGLVEDGKAGTNTNAKLDEILKKLKEAQNSDAQAIRKAWNDFLNAINK